MNEIYEKYNNKYFVINLYDKKYNAQFFKKDNQLKIKILDRISREELNKINRKFKVVIATIDKKEVSIFNLNKCSISSGMDEKFEICYIFDEFIENLKYTSVKNKKIKRIAVEFYNINEMTNLQLYEFDNGLNPIFKTANYKFNYNNISAEVFIGNTISCGYSRYENRRNIIIYFNYDRKIKYMDAVKEVFHFKIFLSLISKREIGIRTIKFNDDCMLYMNCVLFKEKEFSNEWFEHHYMEFLMKIEDIEKDLSNVYSKYKVFLEEAQPIFDIYLDILRHDTTDLNRFLNYTQIIEYISKNYDDANATNIWIKNGRPSGRVTLSDRIESIINQVSYVWRISEKKQYNLSRKIANGRNYYNHHTDEKKKLNDDELFRIPYFLEDLILAYIYQHIGIETKVIKESLNNNIYYDKKFLTTK